MNIQVWALTDAEVGHYISFLLSRHLRAEEREPDYTVVFQWKDELLNYVIKSNPCPAYKPVDFSVLCHPASKTGFATPCDKLSSFYV